MNSSGKSKVSIFSSNEGSSFSITGLLIELSVESFAMAASASSNVAGASVIPVKPLPSSIVLSLSIPKSSNPSGD